MGIQDSTPDGDPTPRFVGKVKQSFKDWKQAPPLRDDIVAGLHRYGFAPGGYSGMCAGCNTEMMMVDKRATSCYECAIAAALFEARQMDAIYALTDQFAKTTGGPWKASTDPLARDCPSVEMARFSPAHLPTDGDAEFVAAAREALAPILQLRLDRLQKAREMMGRG